MTYKASTSSRNPYFSSYRSSTQSFSTTPNDFLFDTFRNINESSNAGYLKLDTDSFLIGEIRSNTVGGGSYRLFDIAIKSHTGSEGYQVRSNASATVLMDDACYGVLSANTETTVRAMNESTTSTAPYTDANELRIIGVRL